MHAHQITDYAKVLVFVLAGNAKFTIVSKATGTRFTYRVKRSDDGKVRFVSLMNGPDNESSYAFFGTIFQDGKFRHSHKARMGADAPAAKAWAWFWSNLQKHHLSPTVEVWHEGKCGRCGRTLTVPESIESGYGPECAGRMGVFAEPVAKRTTLTGLATGDLDIGSAHDAGDPRWTNSTLRFSGVTSKTNAVAWTSNM